jgi:hypothetical protein
MAEITVDCYECGRQDPIGTVKITPRGNGYEMIKTGIADIEKVYNPGFNLGAISVILSKSEGRGRGERGPCSYFRGMLTNPSDFKPIYFTKADALKLYDFFAEQIEWSPSALESGTAHPDLLAAKARHSAAGRGGGTRRKRRM